MDLATFFALLWQQYSEQTPQAARIHQLFSEAGDVVTNDHIAFRSIDYGPFQIDALEPHLLNFGYQRLAPYTFEKKHLTAWSYQHPDGRWPLIFFSQLERAHLSKANRQLLEHLLDQGIENLSNDARVFTSGPLWPRPSWREYQQLELQSDYAAWFAIWGLRANHFTVSINHLEHHPSIEAVIALLQRHQIPLNTTGGLIKGTPNDLLVQASTLADQHQLTFDDGVHAIAGCYYEFARRYHDSDGQLFQGFTTQNADKIFHSTDRAQSH